MGPAKTNVIVIGEGISGLCAAYWLKKRGIGVTLLAKDSEAGGTMKSVRDQGFLYETGANTGLETTPLIKELISDLKLEHEFQYANPDGNNRFILRNGQLRALPLGAGSFLTSKLFSARGKLRLMKEPFIGRADKEESVAEFVTRRLGKEFSDYAIDPFVAGVFAGRPDRLSVRSAFPKLYALEERYGGLVKGMIQGAHERKQRAEKAKDRAETFSFRSGMQTLPNALAAALKKEIALNAKVIAIQDLAIEHAAPPTETDVRRYLVEYRHNEIPTEIEADYVVFATAAYDAASILKSLSKEIAPTLTSIYYPPVVSLFLGYHRNDIAHPLNGFGYLIPSIEKRKILGCLWTSSLFPGRAPNGMTALNAFIGGARQPEMFDLNDEQIVDVTLNELQTAMQISGKPVYLHLTRWPKSIPQYELGYQHTMDALNEFEEQHPGIFFAGNYCGGISVGDCIKNAYDLANRVADEIANK
ncbi:MAG TPA: protoporphyrinogen oxidase [Bacteroidota bacterium]|nr:protoporphyrinogen oxidase [Bacteroidota bacterium]